MFYGIDRTASTRYRSIYRVQDMAAFPRNMSWIDEMGTYGTFLMTDDTHKIEAWNTVWAQIGAEYNKKVFCES